MSWRQGRMKNANISIGSQRYGRAHHCLVSAWDRPWCDCFNKKTFWFSKNITCDVTDFATLERIIKDGKFDAIINCVGILNQFAENNPDQAILLNAYLPHFLAKIIKNIKTKLIQMSTDCVFSGRRGTYNEASIPDGETYYDRTKALGEVNDS